jgi:ABC-type lipoprotein export system ATPase subunit
MRIMELILESAKNGAAVLLVTHDETLAARAHSRLHLENGVLG